MTMCVANIIHCVYFDIEQIRRLVRGAADIFFTNYFVYPGPPASNFDVEKNTEQAICDQLKSMYVKSLFTVRVSLDLKDYSCSCENILHVETLSETFCRESVIDWPTTQFNTGGGPHLFRFMNGDCSNLRIPSLDGGMYCQSALINNAQTIDAILNGPCVFVRNGNF